MWLAVRHYRRFPLIRRAYLRSRQTLDGTGGEVLIAAVCALAAAIWQGTHEAQTRTHLLLSVSLWSLAAAGLIGAVLGLLLVRGGAVVVELVRYPLSRYRNKVWQARPGRVVADQMLFELVCTAHPPVEVSTLGYMEFEVKDPCGASLRLLDGALEANPGKVLAFCKWKPRPGTYEVRWYASTEHRKLHEITRAKFSFPDHPRGVA